MQGSRGRREPSRGNGFPRCLSSAAGKPCEHKSLGMRSDLIAESCSQRLHLPAWEESCCGVLTRVPSAPRRLHGHRTLTLLGNPPNELGAAHTHRSGGTDGCFPATCETAAWLQSNTEVPPPQQCALSSQSNREGHERTTRQGTQCSLSRGPSYALAGSLLTGSL